MGFWDFRFLANMNDFVLDFILFLGPNFNDGWIFWAYLGVLVGLANLIDCKFVLFIFLLFFDGGLLL